MQHFHTTLYFLFPFSAVDYDNGDNFFILVIAITSGKDNIDVSVSITVKPENEHAPVFNNPDEVTLPEDAEVGTTISALFATDNDTSPHDIVRYTLNSGNQLMLIFHLLVHFKLSVLHNNLDYSNWEKYLPKLALYSTSTLKEKCFFSVEKYFVAYMELIVMIFTRFTVKITSIRTNGTELTMQKEQSDPVLQCLLIHPFYFRCGNTF